MQINISIVLAPLDFHPASATVFKHSKLKLTARTNLLFLGVVRLSEPS